MRNKASDTKMASRELHDLIALGEGAELEFKQGFPSDLGREICAMANAIGGRILIGVDDNGRIVSTSFTNRIRSEIQNLARNIVPPVPISIFSIDGVVVIGVPESRNKPHASNGKFYLRDGANTQSMNRDELREFFFREGQLYFDEMPNRKFKVPKSISQDKYRMFVRESAIPESLPMMDALRNLKVIDGAMMTNAGTLIFGDHGSDYLISATITTEYGMPDPIIEADENWFSLTFPRPEKIDSQKSSRENARNAVEKSREKSREKILSIIRTDARITISELAEKTGLSIKGIEKNIRLLKQENKLKRVGPDKGGHWEVV